MWPIDPVSEATIASVWLPIDFVEELIGGEPPQLGQANCYFRWDETGNEYQFLSEEQSANLDIFRDITPGEAGTDLLGLSTLDDVQDYLRAPCLDDDNIFTGKNFFNLPFSNGQRIEIRKDPFALDYKTTRASFIIQHADYVDGLFNKLYPATVTSIWNDSDGWVDGPQGLSMTIWTGNYTYVTKKGNASAQGYTVGGELGPCDDYNELGAFQAVLSNSGSQKGYLSLFEGLVQDSADGGVHAYRTRLATAAFRAAKYHPTSDFSSTIVVSSEGPLPIDAAMLVNNMGYQRFKHLIDARNATITTGQAIVLGNNTNVAWQNAAKTDTTPILWVSNSDDTYLSSDGNIHFVSDTVADKMVIDTNHPNDAVCIFVGGALRRVILGASVSGGANLLLAI